MQEPQQDFAYDRLFVRNMVESALRIGLICLLLASAYDIIRPFTVPLLWGAIIAIAANPVTRWLEPRVGGRRGLASALLTLFFLVLLVVPCYLLTESVLVAAQSLSQKLNNGGILVPPPPESVAGWPLVGDRLFAQWNLASDNLEELLESAHPQIRALLSSAITAVGRGLAGVGLFAVALLIAGGFMAYADSAGAMAKRLFVRLAGEHPGGDWDTMVVATVRSVLTGVVGVAIIQAVLCAIGLFAMGVPGAPIWSALILPLAIAQLPVIIVVLPLIIWAFSTQDGTAATLFTVWMLLAALSDNILKPMLMGRGLDVPMPVILIGAIGGMLAAGIIGLFAGAVVLSIGYKLFIEWLQQGSR